MHSEMSAFFVLFQQNFVSFFSIVFNNHIYFVYVKR